MTDSILEHLRYIRDKVNKTADEVEDLKVRVAALEQPRILISFDVIEIYLRLDRIERRLEIQE